MQGPSAEMLLQLTVESSQLLGCIKLLNHKVHKSMLQGQMDSKLAGAHSFDKFYKTYVVSLCSLLSHCCVCAQDHAPGSGGH